MYICRHTQNSTNSSQFKQNSQIATQLLLAFDGREGRLWKNLGTQAFIEFLGS